jgi:hypothetical protein
MGKNFRPTPAQRKEKRAREKIRKNLFELKIDEEIDHDWLNSLNGKISFLTGTLGFIEPNSYCRRYRVSTRKYIPFQTIQENILPCLPEEAELRKGGLFNITHAFDVTFPEGIRVDTFVWRISKALEEYL